MRVGVIYFIERPDLSIKTESHLSENSFVMFRIKHTQAGDNSFLHG